MKVGIFLSNLSEPNPRGVVRVARAISEALSYDDVEYFAITDGFYNDKNIIVHSYPLNEYLSVFPINSAVKQIKKKPKKSQKDYSIKYLYLPTVLDFILNKHLVTFFDALARKIGLQVYADDFYDWVKKGSIFRKKKNRVITAHLIAEKIETALKGQNISINNFDAIVSFHVFDTIWDWPVENFKCRKIGFIHDCIPLRINEGSRGEPDKFFRTAGKFALRADDVICISKSTERDVNSFFPASKGKTTVIYNGHDKDRFAHINNIENKNEDETVHLLMLGEIERRKNIHNVLLSMPLLARQLGSRKIKLTLVGNQSSKNHFEHLSELANRFVEISWIQYPDDNKIVELMASSDVFLVPSLWEGFGLSVLEAMSANVPVVCSNLSSLPEVGGEYAFYCDPYEPQSIADAVQRVVDMDREELVSHLRKAREWAAQFTWKRTADQLHSLILDRINSNISQELDRIH